MNTDKSSGLSLVPREPPGEVALGQFLEDPMLAEAILRMEEPQRQVVLWTAALQTWVVQGKLWERIPGFRFCSVGFADPETEEDAFGVLVYVEPLNNQEEKFTIEVAGRNFRLIVRPSFEVLHSWPQVHPINGTATCWAQSRKQRTSEFGFVTAKHVLDGALAGTATPTTAGKGKILEVAPDSIDAALIAVPASFKGEPGPPLHCTPYVAQWTDVQFEGMGSRRPVITKVTEVWFRVANDPSLPGRVFLAFPGKSGDSGALVQDTAGNGIGIYLGGLVNVATQKMEGFCQHLGQAASILECKLYK